MTPEQLHVVLAEAALSTLRPAEDPAPTGTDALPSDGSSPGNAPAPGAVPTGTVLRRGGDVAAGDWQSNLPLRLGTREPLSTAESIAEAVASHPDIASVTVTGPGFLRIVLETPALLGTVAQVAAGRHLGDPGSGATLASSDRLMEPASLGVLDADALRYGSARSRTATVLARDVELLRTAAPANPLHRVQHAHATGRRLLRRAAAAGIRVAAGLAVDEAEHRTPDVTLAPADRQLALRITEAAGVLARATGTATTASAATGGHADTGSQPDGPQPTGRHADTRSQSDSPQPTGRYDGAGRHADTGRRPGESLRSVTAVLEDLAAALTAWSAAERAIVPTLDADITAVHAARCVLAAGATTVLATGLRLLGVTAPERI
ncbi:MULTISPECIES: DALR anticodon-binding domain-containing protein [unclassified Brevibacterium]|uniref:DALR anticodon-binding domain-containing protein n=1 Tax=unclassified Brevibacterium TaxID=2614124 RepID=UPI001BAAC37D|nr:DALR anticodon-binding domain-containing protein [Brevibacterium sp. W7.2]